MKKYKFILVIFIFYSLCFCEKISHQKSENSKLMNQNKSLKAVVLKGKITSKKFQNKRNIKLDYSEFYFETTDNEGNIELLFIKISENKFNKAFLESLVGRELHIEAYIQDGFWDSDNPEAQSIIGKYISIIKILD